MSKMMWSIYSDNATDPEGYMDLCGRWIFVVDAKSLLKCVSAGALAGTAISAGGYQWEDGYCAQIALTEEYRER